MGKFKCSHCRLIFDENSAIISENGDKFCCNGCKNVYQMLYSQGFDEFYSRLGKNSLTPAKIATKTSSDAIKNLYKNYVKDENGFSKISLVIDGIHCSACIWLNEKVLFNTPGILEVNINSTNNKASIVWDDTQVKLDEIFTRINSIGYNAYVYDVTKNEALLDAKRREFYIKLLVGVFCVMNIMWIAIAQYSGYFLGMDSHVRDILNFAEFVLATPVLFYTGSAFFKGYLVAFKSKTPNMDMLIATGASLAYIYSIWAMFSRQGEVYFDSVAMIITFVFIGKFLEVLSKKRANDTIDTLSSMISNEVCIKEGADTSKIDIHQVKIGDTIVLKAGDKALIDGRITDGCASFDYSYISGESIPVTLNVNDDLKSGCICLDGYVEYEATNLFKDSLLNRIITLLESANLKKPHIEQLANTISSKFSFVVIIMAIATFVFWLFSGHLGYFLNFDSSNGFEKALIISISVIVIACPCALALATPVSTLVALGVGLKKSIIFKESLIIESLSKCDTVVFDKTGTLTKGNLKVDSFEIFNDFDPSVIYALANTSKHPISVAICEFLADKVALSKELSNAKEFASKGVSAKFKGKVLLGGSAKFIKQNGIDFTQDSQASEYIVAFDGCIVAKFMLSDEIKSDSKDVIDKLKQLKFNIYMLTGDNANVAKYVALNLGIDEFKSSMLPDDKAYFIKSLEDSGKKVLMVGDGINDSLAMSYASVAVCMGSGADVSIQKSDIVLLNDDLSSLLFAINISKKTFKIIKQNLLFSLCYNAFTIPLAMFGFVIPLFAALSMSFSSLVVVLNSLRIKKLKEHNG